MTTLNLVELCGYALKNTFEDRCYVESALMDMYAKCGRLNFGHQIFTKLSERVACGMELYDHKLYLKLAKRRSYQSSPLDGLEGLRCDCVTVSSDSACASSPALCYGKEMDAFLMRGSLRLDLYAISALIDMYAKCGDSDIACHVI